MWIRLLVDNILIGTRVCGKGDVLDLPSQERKKQLVKLGIAEWYDSPPKPKHKPADAAAEHKPADAAAEHKPAAPEAPEAAAVEHSTQTATMPKPSRKTRPDNV